MKQDEKVWVVPDLEVRVNESWVRLVRFCQTQLTHGTIKIRIVHAQPTELIEAKRSIRFDKEETVEGNFDPFS